MKLLPLRKILCPTDFSDASHEALEAAEELARTFTAELILIHAIPPTHVIQSPNPPSALYSPTFVKEMEGFAFKTMEKLVRKKLSKKEIQEDIQVRTMVVHGNPADEIVKRADSENVDLIVIATHGMTGWRHMVFGSVAEKVVRLAPCPVLTILAPHEDG